MVRCKDMRSLLWIGFLGLVQSMSSSTAKLQTNTQELSSIAVQSSDLTTSATSSSALQFPVTTTKRNSPSASSFQSQDGSGTPTSSAAVAGPTQDPTAGFFDAFDNLSLCLQFCAADAYNTSACAGISDGSCACTNPGFIESAFNVSEVIIRNTFPLILRERMKHYSWFRFHSASFRPCFSTKMATYQ
jgi:hypothetical protein